MTTLTLTPPAAQRLRRVLSAAPSAAPSSGVRVALQGDACSGYKYSLAVAAAPQPDDVEVEQADLRLFIDGRSALLLSGTEIDYIEGLNRGGFKFNNPNLGGGCSSCGSSKSGGCGS